MKIIAHRANLNGPNPWIENSPVQIDLCISKGYDVEIDLWYIGGEFYLGHDTGMYNISYSFLLERKENIWIHCKNQEVLFKLYKTDFNYFWHQEDDVTITSKKYIWSYPGKQKVFGENLIVLDFSNTVPFDMYENLGVFGVCVDYVGELW